MKIGKKSIGVIPSVSEEYGSVRSQNLAYYDNNNQQYFDISFGFDMNNFYDRFLSHGVVDGGKILDAGCGVGRDTKNFIERGYQVSSFDGSQKMVDFCNQVPGANCIKSDFIDIKYPSKEFDGIWCCASLLHLPTEAFDLAINNLTESLNDKGVFYFSIKQLENGYFFDGERHFYNPGEQHIIDLFESHGLTLTDSYKTGKQNDPAQTFISYIFKKV